MEFLAGGRYQASSVGTLACRLDSMETAAYLMMHAGRQTGMCKVTLHGSGRYRLVRHVVELMPRSSLAAIHYTHTRASAMQNQAKRETAMSSAYPGMSVSTWG